MSFPQHRPRRLRSTGNIRSLVRETTLTPADLVLPLFLHSGKDVCAEIPAMPGCNALSGKPLVDFAKTVRDHGVPALLLFAITDPAEKDPAAAVATRPDAALMRGLRELREAVPELLLIADLCLCEYKPDGHCGIFHEGLIDNDATLERIGEISAVLAANGADVIAPSGMMDGVVQTIRRSLDKAGFTNTMTMPYSAKYCSALYGPFKAGTDSNPEFSLHDTHQMDVANRREATREIALDLEEGADMIIVKPALTNLDVIRDARERFSIPIAAYQVSGEAAMIRSAGEAGFVDADALLMETLLCIRRAGANMIITYSALDVAARLQA